MENKNGGISIGIFASIFLIILGFLGLNEYGMSAEGVLISGIAIYIGIYIIFSFWCISILTNKNREQGLGFILGLFWFIGVLVSYIIPARKIYNDKNKYEKLEKIADLKKQGLLTEEEYNIEKAKILNN